MKQNYLPRVLDQVIKEKLNLYGAVLVEGCKWCGKSTTARQLAKSILELQDPATIEDNLELAKLNPSILLEGEKPRLIDEWQDAPELWDAIRYDVDRTNLPNQYILTGSATPSKNKPRHTGTGRIIRLTMRPMSLFESKDSTGEVSLRKIFNGETKIVGTSRQNLDGYAYLCARGGWPIAITRRMNHSTEVAEDYLTAIAENDISSVDSSLHSPSKMRAVLRSIARNVCQPVNYNTILTDTATNDTSVSLATIKSYIETLNRLHIIDNIPAWSPQLRSKTEIRTSEKLNLVDPSLSVAALFSSERDLIRDIRTFGFIFESLCMRDLKVYTKSLNGDVYYYRDSYGLECDAIIHLHDGRWGLVEIKLGTPESIDSAAENFKKLQTNIDTSTMGSPTFAMILTATRHAYRREDGVFVVPIGCLKP